MKVGKYSFTCGGADFYYAWFWDYGDGNVYCGYNGKVYPLKAFVTQK